MRARWLSTACMSKYHSVLSLEASCVGSSSKIVRTVSVNHPFSALLSCASLNVEVSTALSFDTGGAGGRPGFLRVKSCLTTGGRCFTTMVNGPDGLYVSCHL